MSEEHPALKAILSGVTDPAERERLTEAYHTLSQGDIKSFPVVFALVANGAAMSIAVSAAHIVAAVTKQSSKPTGLSTSSERKSFLPNLLIGVAAGIASSLIATFAAISALNARAEAQALKLEAKYQNVATLVSDLTSQGGELRYYTTTDTNGQPIRAIILDGGMQKPTQAFLTPTRNATIILPNK